MSTSNRSKTTYRFAVVIESAEKWDMGKIVRQLDPALNPYEDNFTVFEVPADAPPFPFTDMYQVKFTPLGRRD